MRTHVVALKRWHLKRTKIDDVKKEGDHARERLGRGWPQAARGLEWNGLEQYRKEGGRMLAPVGDPERVHLRATRVH
jgi:hypothetical protein